MFHPAGGRLQETLFLNFIPHASHNWQSLYLKQHFVHLQLTSGHQEPHRDF